MTKRKISSFTISLADSEDEFDVTTHNLSQIQTAFKIFHHPNFCVVNNRTGKKVRKVLIDRAAISLLASKKVNNENPHQSDNIDPIEDLGHKGLYIHKSVIEGLEGMICYAKNMTAPMQSKCDMPYFDTSELKAAERVHYLLSVGIDLLGEDTTYTATCHWK